MIKFRDACVTIALIATVAPPAAFATPQDAAPAAAGQRRPAAPLPGQPSYARVAGLATASVLTIDATVRSASALAPAESPGLAPGYVRVYVVADVGALVRGPGGLATRIAYLADVRADARGRPPRLKKRRVMLFARPVAGRSGEVQLVAPDAQLDWSPALDARVRAIAAELVGPDAAPRITGVGNATHVPGTLAGEGETTIFLNTPSGNPVSLTVLRRPGQERSWSVSLSEVVTDTAGAVRPETLLWYRLACGLPRTLPEEATASASPEDAATARDDYGFVLEQLGSCEPG